MRVALSDRNETDITKS